MIPAVIGAAAFPIGSCPVFDMYPYASDEGDYLTLPDGSRVGARGAPNNRAECPIGTILTPGQTLSWHSDFAGQGDVGEGDDGDGLPYSQHGAGGGWQICFE